MYELASGTGFENAVVIVPPDSFATYHVQFSPCCELKFRTLLLKEALASSPDFEHYLYGGRELVFVPRAKSKILTKSVQGFDITLALQNGDGVPGNHLDTGARPFAREGAIQDLTSLLVNRAMSFNYIAMDNCSFYSPSHALSFPPDNLEVWPGFRIYVDTSRSLMRISTVWKVLRGSALDRIKSSAGGKVSSNSVCEQELLGENIIALHNYCEYRVISIDWSASPLDVFDLNGKKISHVMYYHSEYSLSDIASVQPMLVCERLSRGRDRVLLPPQLCMLTGVRRKMGSSNSADLALTDALAPATFDSADIRIHKTQTLIDFLNRSDSVNALFSVWRFQLKDRLRSAQFLLPSKQFRGPAVTDPKGMRNWIVVAPDDAETLEAAQILIDLCQKIGPSMRTKVGGPLCQTVKGESVQSYTSACQQALEKVRGQPVQMFVVILKGYDMERYSELKKLFCLRNNIPSQFVCAESLLSMKSSSTSSFVSNLLKQMNCKMDGAPCRVSMPTATSGIMFVGFTTFSMDDDICEDELGVSPLSVSEHGGQRVTKKVLSFAASFSDDCSKWTSSCCVYTTMEEMLRSIALFVKKSLRTYYLANKECLPKRVIFYRSGVERESQIEDLIKTDVDTVRASILAVCKKNSCAPFPFSFIVVRPSPTYLVLPNAEERTFSDPEVGTVVLVGESHRREFLLRSDERDVRLTAYTILHEDRDLTVKDLYAVAFNLCHLYYNWEGSVRMPAPCQYAQKLALLFARGLHDADGRADLQDKPYYR